MNNENLISWMAETITGGRPACAGTITIGDNGRHKTFSEYRLILSYEDENGDSDRIEVIPEVWRVALLAALT